MNTLQELNNYSNSQIPFEDDRSLIITVGNTTTTTQSVTVAEDTPVDLSTFGVTFSELRSLDEATADHITLTFDFSAATNPRIVWPDKPAYVESNTRYNNITFGNPAPGVFVADNIQLNSDYLAVLANTNIVAQDQSAVYSYTITVSWPGNSYTQQFDVTTIPAAETNLNGLSLTARSITEHLLFDPTLTPRPAIVDQSPGSIYELVLTSSVGNTLGLNQGDTPTTSITIPGNRETVNTALQSVYYTPAPGFINSTDTINYTLTVTNPSLGSPYVSETGSFDNYVPPFGNVLGITNRTTYISQPQELFVSPYPTVEDNIGSNLITLDITATSGQLKESATTGSWGNSLVLTGSSAQLSAALQLIQYHPDTIYGSNTDTLSYQLRWSGFNLDSGTFDITTVIDISITNLNNTGDVVADPGTTDLFPAGYNGGALPTITSLDTATNYELTLTYNNITIDGNTNSRTWAGSAAGLQSSLRGAQFKPLVQGTTVTINYELRLNAVLMTSGSFTKQMIEFFEFVNLNSSYTMPTTDTFALLSNVLLVDNTPAGNLVPTVEMNITVGDTRFSPGNLQTVTYTDNCSNIQNDIQAQLIDPLNTSTTQIINYMTVTLTYDSILWVNRIIDITVKPDVELFNFDASRTYALNTVSDLFPSNYPIISDVDALTYTLTFTTNDGYLRFDTDTAPHTNTISITGTPTTISGTLASNTIDLIPSGGNVNDITVSYDLEYSSTSIDSGSFTVSRLGGSALPEQIYQTSGYLEISVNDDHRFFYKSDILMVAQGGIGGSASGLSRAGGGGGGGGVIYHEDTNLFLNRSDNKYTLTGDSINRRTDACIFAGSGTGGTNLIRVYGGGPGGNDPNNNGDDGGYGGGGSANGPTLGGSAILPTLPAGYTAATQLTLGGVGEDGNQGPQPWAGDGGGNLTTSIDATGTAVIYSKPGLGLDSTIHTEPGSGGRGALTDSSGNLVHGNTYGKPGLMFIRFYQ